MTRPDINALPQFYKRYVDRLKEKDVYAALQDSMDEVDTLIRSISQDIQDYRYAEDKWTIREVLCHMLDVERIMASRSLRFARNDRTPLACFEENDYAPESNPTSRDISKLADELHRLRLTTLDLFNSFSPEMLDRQGIANNMEFSVVNLGYIIAGHSLHHCAVLRERYLKQ